MDSVEEQKVDAETKRITAIYYLALDIALLLIVVSVAVYVFRLLNYSLHTQINTYIDASSRAGKQPDHGPALVLTFTKAMDAAIVKSTVVFMGFIVTLLGAMYVLRAATATFSLDVKSGTGNGTLNTSSPGLVMVVLGIVAVGLALYSKVDLTIEESRGGRAQSSDMTAPNPKIVGVGSINTTKPNEAQVKEEETKRNSAVVVTARGGAPVVELPPFADGSAELSAAQKQLLQTTAFTILKIDGAEVHFTDKADGSIKPEEWEQLEIKRRDSVNKYLVQLKPSIDPFEFFKGHIEASQQPSLDDILRKQKGQS